jgi:hypothetical protein
MQVGEAKRVRRGSADLPMAELQSSGISSFRLSTLELVIQVDERAFSEVLMAGMLPNAYECRIGLIKVFAWLPANTFY